MAEVLRKRVKTRFIWFDPEDPDSLMSGQEEEVYEPIDVDTAEFAGVTETAKLDHGQLPIWPENERSIYKVYEKVAVWLRRVPAPKEATA